MKFISTVNKRIPADNPKMRKLSLKYFIIQMKKITIKTSNYRIVRRWAKSYRYGIGAVQHLHEQRSKFGAHSDPFDTIRITSFWRTSAQPYWNNDITQELKKKCTCRNYINNFNCQDDPCTIWEVRSQRLFLTVCLFLRLVNERL